jgi:hypothetical protein
VISALVTAVVLAGANPCWPGEGEGTFSVCFDPGNRLALGVGGARMGDAQGLLLSGGLHLRRSRESRSHAHVAWSTEHVVLDAAVLRHAGSWVGEVTAYDGLFVRHLDDGYLLLPTATPTRVPFPFDVAVAVRAGTVERDLLGRERLELVRSGVLLDAARDPRGLFRISLGPTLAFALERDRQGVRPARMQPLSGGTLLLRAESDDGHWLAQARVDAGLELAPRARSTFRVHTFAAIERVLVAINDQPITLQLSVTDLRGTEPGSLRAGVALVGAFEL